MKRKLGIFSNIAIICLSVCMFAFGVYAANTVSVTTGGTVTFKATDVYADVIRTVSGAKDVLETDELKAEIRADAKDGQKYPLNVENENLTFADVNEPIIMTFEIQNLGDDRNVDFKVINNSVTTNTNVEMEVFVSANMYDTTNEIYNINPCGLDGDTETVKLVFRVINPNLSANLTYNLEIDISSQDEVASNVTVANKTVTNGSTIEKVGNTYLVSTNLYNNSTDYQLTNYSYSVATGYYEYVPAVSGTNIVSPIHIFDTTAQTITANMESVTTLLTFADVSNGATGITSSNVTTSGTDLVIPMAVSKSGSVGLVTRIDSYCFDGVSNIKSITFPISLKTLGDSAVTGNSNLETITFLGRYINNLNDFWSSFIRYNKNLATIKINTLEYTSGTGNNMIYQKIERGLCVGTKNLTTIPEGTKTINTNAYNSSPAEVVIPDSVIRIAGYAFDGCTTLESVTIGKGITEIYGNTFGCPNLEVIKFGSNVKTIAGDAFTNNESFSNASLSKIYYYGTLTDYLNINYEFYIVLNDTDGFEFYLNDELISEIIVPSGITSIPGYAFCNLSQGFEKIVIPTSVTQIDSNAFMNLQGIDSNEVYFEYQGTMAQWEAITKDSEWNSGTANVIKNIICTDGTIENK